jgi:hypothetical protein
MRSFTTPKCMARSYINSVRDQSKYSTKWSWPLSYPKVPTYTILKPGIHRIISFVSEYLSSPTRIETRSFYNQININTQKIHSSKLKTEEEILKTRNLHSSWITSLPTNAIVIYSDGSRSSTGSVGAGWIIYRKLQSSLKIVQKDFCNLGDRMEVFDAELHEGLQCIISRDICDPGYIYLCIDNTSAIDVLADNPNRIEGAFKTTDAWNTLTRNG